MNDFDAAGVYAGINTNEDLDRGTILLETPLEHATLTAADARDLARWLHRAAAECDRLNDERSVAEVRAALAADPPPPGRQPLAERVRTFRDLPAAAPPDPPPPAVLWDTFWHALVDDYEADMARRPPPPAAADANAPEEPCPPTPATD